MKTLSKALAPLALLGCLTIAGVSMADVPPPDTCQGEGTSCNNAGTAANEPGTCQMAKCQKAGPDGSTEYDCLRCIAGGGGSGGAAGSGTGGAGGAGTGGAATGGTGTGGAKSGNSSSDDGGCTLSANQARGSIVGLLVALGIGLLGAGRRRRR